MAEKHTTRRRYITGKLVQRPGDLMSAFLDSSTTLFCAVNDRGEYVVFNKACENITGYSYEEMAGKSFFALIAPSEHQRLRDMWATRDTRDTGEVLLPWKSKDGELHQIRWYFARFDDSSGQPEFIACVGHDVTDRLRAEAEWRESEARFAAMFQGTSAMMFLTDPDTGRIVDANPASAAFYGWPLEVLRGKPLWEINSLSREDSLQKLASLKASNGAHLESQHRLASGESRNVEIYTSPIQVGGHILLHTIVHDVSERKRAEEALRHSEERFTAIFLGTSAIMFLTDPSTGQFIDVNPACASFYGYTIEELRTMSVWDINTLDKQAAMAVLQRASGGGLHRNFKHRLKSGAIRDVEVYSSPVTTGGRRLLHTIVHDVTARVAAERALTASEELNRRILEAVPGGVVQVAMDGSIQSANVAAQRILGMPWDEMKSSFVQSWATQTVHEDGTPCSAEDYPVVRCLRTGQPQPPMTIGVRQPDKSIHWAVFTAVPLTDHSSGTMVGSVVTFLDVTQRMLTDAALKVSEERFRTLVEEATEAICIADGEGRHIEANSRACELFGYTREELALAGIVDAVPVEDRHLIAPRMAEMRKGIPQRWERVMQRKDGSRFPVEISARFLSDGRLMAIIRDISDRRRAEEAIRESELRFRQLADAAPVFIWLANDHGKRTYFSRGWIEFTGRALDDELDDGWLNGVHAADAQRISDMLADALASRQDFNLEYRLRASDGEFRWVLDRGVPRFSERGEFSGYIGSCLDITERKRAEEALRKSELEYRTLMEQAGEGILILDERQRLVDANTRACEILGYSKQRISAISLSELVLSTDRPRFSALMVPLDRGETVRIEGDLLRLDGQSVPTEISARRIGPSRYLAIFRDVTERKRAEFELRESQRRLATLFSNLPGMAYRCNNDPDWTMTFISEGGKQLTGYTVDELTGGKVSYGGQIIQANDRQRVWEEVQKALAERQGFTLNYQIVRKDGVVRDVWEQGRGVFAENGELLSLEGFVTDVTERRQAEAALRESQQRYQAFIAQSTEGIWRFEFEVPIDLDLDVEAQVDLAQQGGVLAECNDVMARMYGYERAEQMVGVRIRDMLDMSDPANRETFRQFARARFRITDLESHEVDREGHHHYFLNNVVGIFENGKIVRIWGTQRDVTEQRKAARALVESEERFKRLASATEEGIIIHAQGRVIDANQRASEMSGYPTEELIGLDIRKLAAPESLPSVLAVIAAGHEGTNEYVGMRKDGSTFPCELTSRKITLSGREVRVVAVRDITERKRAERALQESELRYKRLSGATAEAILIHEQGRVIDANQRVTAMFGYSAEELLKMNAFSLATPETRDMVISNVRAGSETPYEAMGLRKDGTTFPGEITARNLVLGGKQVRVVAIRDITERKHAEEALRREAGIVRLMQRVAMAANESTSSEAAMRLVINEICDYTGWPVGHAYLVDSARQELYPTEIWRLDLPAEHAEFKAMNMAARFGLGVGLPGAVLRDRRPYWIEDVAQDAQFPGGRTRTGLGIISSFAFPVLVGKEVVAAMEFATGVRTPSDPQLLDIMANIGTQLGRVVERQRASELLESRVAERTRQLEAANRELSQRAIELTAINQELESFSYSVSHDLRAPLRGIFGFSQALQEDFGKQLGSEGEAMLDRIKSASQRMGRLIDDLLGLSRVTRAEMAKENVDLSTMAHEICAELRKNCPQRRIDLDIQPGITAVGDPRLLRVLMQNLLDNAFKFTSRTEHARISFSVEPTEHGPGYIVSDNGAGYDMQYADKLFGAFQRLHSLKEFEGTGIGLATVQRIVHRHGGLVRAQGAPGKGASIQFTLGVRGAK